jgi:hypothetical protein
MRGVQNELKIQFRANLKIAIPQWLLVRLRNFNRIIDRIHIDLQVMLKNILGLIHSY